MNRLFLISPDRGSRFKPIICGEKRERDHLSFAFTVLSPLACCTIRERGQHYNKKMLFTKLR
jgi:hypothetical protein